MVNSVVFSLPKGPVRTVSLSPLTSYDPVTLRRADPGSRVLRIILENEDPVPRGEPGAPDSRPSRGPQAARARRVSVLSLRPIFDAPLAWRSLSRLASYSGRFTLYG